MQITIDKKTGILSTVIVILLGGILFMAGSRSGVSNIFGMDHSMMPEGASSSKGSLVGSDTMFFQMMIPHHQQAVDISELAMKTSKDSELIALAKEIRDGQATEIVQMTKWLADAGQDVQAGHHMGDGMGGMLTDSELATLKASTGTAFDVYWLERMITHHEGALHMVTMIENSPSAAVETFGKNIVKVQTAQIGQMKEMLKRLGA